MNQCTGRLPQAPMQEAVSKEWVQHKSPSTDHGSTGRHATCATRVIASGRHLSANTGTPVPSAGRMDILKVIAWQRRIGGIM